MNNLLKISNLSFKYEGEHILKNINFENSTGKLTGVIGPNGAGKSTLFRLITGTLKPTNGEIVISGQNVSELSIKNRAKLVSLVPQNPEIPSTLSVYETVLFGRHPYTNFLGWENKKDLDATNESLKLKKIEHLGKRKIQTLSGGEKQKVLISMSVAQNTPITLLDEPTSNLDIDNQILILNTIKNLQKNNHSFLISLHDLNLASLYCDELILLSKGKIITIGTPKSVLTEDNIKKAYDTEIKILEHPVYNTPIITPIISNPSK